MKNFLSFLFLLLNIVQVHAQVNDLPSKKRKLEKQKYSDQFGIYLGTNKIKGDVRSQYVWARPMHIKDALCFGAIYNHNLYKNLISTNINFQYGSASGYNWNLNDGFKGHYGNPYNDGYTMPDGVKTPGYSANDLVIYSFKTNYAFAGANLKFATPTFNKLNIYILAGASVLLFSQSFNDAYLNNGEKYNFSEYVNDMNNNRPNFFLSSQARKYVDEQLGELFDGVYESKGESVEASLKRKLPILVNAGIGAQYKLSKKCSLQFQYLRSKSTSDLLDAQQWQPSYSIIIPTTTTTAPTASSDGIRAYTLGILYNLK